MSKKTLGICSIIMWFSSILITIVNFLDAQRTTLEIASNLLVILCSIIGTTAYGAMKKNT